MAISWLLTLKNLSLITSPSQASCCWMEILTWDINYYSKFATNHELCAGTL
uniref:Uncharacterized protein n=1 Tax=Rhizophora mucronata TaxID=61149 RepID=A0A2P2KK47_RHIMU